MTLLSAKLLAHLTAKTSHFGTCRALAVPFGPNVRLIDTAKEFAEMATFTDFRRKSAESRERYMGSSLKLAETRVINLERESTGNFGIGTRRTRIMWRRRHQPANPAGPESGPRRCLITIPARAALREASTGGDI